MKKFIFLIICCLFNLIVLGQGNVKELTRQGMVLLNEGKYEEAIKTYQKALAINPKSVIANYEISTAYLEIQDYQNALKYSSKAMDLDKMIYLKASIVKGTALDNLGKSYEAIDVFKKALKKADNDYLLYYNLGLVYYNQKDYKNAEVTLCKGLSYNSNHAPSHLILGLTMEGEDSRVQSLLCLHYFLFLEPNTQRSAEAYAELKKQFEGSAKKDAKGNRFSPENTSEKEIEYGAVEILLSMLESSKNRKENANKTEFEIFVENTKSFFQLLGEMDEEKENLKKDIWHQLYIPFFYKLSQSRYMDAYCRFISLSLPESKEWFETNEEKVSEFFTWMNENEKEE